MTTGKNVISKKSRPAIGQPLGGQVGRGKTVGIATAVPDEMPSISSAKTKIPLEIEDPDVLHPAVEEKIEDEPATKEEDGEESVLEEAVLDEEDLNPFGDKWEQ